MLMLRRIVSKLSLSRPLPTLVLGAIFASVIMATLGGIYQHNARISQPGNDTALVNPAPETSNIPQASEDITPDSSPALDPDEPVASDGNQTSGGDGGSSSPSRSPNNRSSRRQSTPPQSQPEPQQEPDEQETEVEESQSNSFCMLVICF